MSPHSESDASGDKNSISSAVTQLNTESTHAWVNEFIQAVSYLLTPGEYKGTAFYKFLVQIARTYHIPVQEIDAILNEGITRGIEYIQKREVPISQPEAWLRRVCLYIMKDRVKANIQNERKTQQVPEILGPLENPLSKTEFLEQLDYLDQAIAQLSKSEQLLLRLKFREGKTYKQIQYHYKLMSENGVAPSIPALRKRESRALAKLREIFLSMYEGKQQAL